MSRKLLDEIDRLYDLPADQLRDDKHSDDARSTFEEFLSGLEAGELRAAKPVGEGEWKVQPSVKRGILIGFRLGEVQDLENAGPLQFSDKDTYPTQHLATRERNIRLVPGGTSVRRGAYIGNNVTMMPPAYVNVGAFVDDGTMVDSHALVGSCAQIGKNVHLSASAQVGGVLEPIGQTPVIVEDDALVGGNTGLYEGVHVRAGAVIGAGCVLTSSTPVFDMVHEEIYRATKKSPLVIPPNAVVIPGSRPARGVFAERNRLHMAALLIIKYRDAKTDSATMLEEMLR
jgi:2,3,4,5-tetrahydropyridine-2-carboxylate N-succinyltransferase